MPVQLAASTGQHGVLLCYTWWRISYRGGAATRNQSCGENDLQVELEDSLQVFGFNSFLRHTLHVHTHTHKSRFLYSMSIRNTETNIRIYIEIHDYSEEAAGF